MNEYICIYDDDEMQYIPSPYEENIDLIRCKDCKYWNGNGKYCDYEMSGLENDYCSWAERGQKNGLVGRI